MDEIIEKNYEIAERRYAEYGIDTEDALKILKNISISVHCWQGDDVGGFEKPDASLSGGGIQATGNYPGKARNINELRQDLEMALSLVPGKHRVNLHSIYGDFGNDLIERNKIKVEDYQSWIDWAKRMDIKLDFNCSLFSHLKADDGFTLSSKSKEIREFWIEHVKLCREISNEIGKQLNDACIHNIWIPDGSKDIPIDRIGHRMLLKNALDDIFSQKYSQTNVKDSLEGKLFGIGSEAFVVGSHEFYLSYVLKNDLMLTIDMGHYHPTESIGDKISSIIPFLNGILLHISRGVRWDSDHVVILNDDLIQLTEEIIRSKAIDRIHYGLDYFDASINRIGAWVIGIRATQKSFLYALLQPLDLLQDYEENGKYFQRLAFLEEFKTMPFGAVWDYFCLKNKVPLGKNWIEKIESYESNVLNLRQTL
ncbi:MAG: L-rhamnose isomerase [Candidatus Hermodarchaeota archaeon]